MKLKYILASFIAAAAVLTGCVQEQPYATLAGLTVSNDYVTLASDEGATLSINVKGEDSWTASVADSKVTWLTLSPSSGSAGQDVTLTFTAAETKSARSTEVFIVMGNKTKIVKVNQAAPAGVVVPMATCQEVVDGPDKNYKIRGTVTAIANKSYGNWYINDGTTEANEGKGIYIYGTFNAKGQYPKDADGGWDGFGIEVGDIVTVEGPKSVYNGVVELVDVSIVKIEKSLIDVAPFDFAKLPPADTTFNMVVSAKESPLLLTSDAGWLQIIAVNEDGSYKLHADENLKTADRTANIAISGPTARKSVSITQAGVPATGASVSEILTQPDGSKVETLPSTVVVALTTRGAVLSDGTKAIYAYGNTAAALSLGDGVKVSAEKTTYNKVPELTNISDVFVDSKGNAITYPEAKDITATAGSYAATEAEFIKLSGTLEVSEDGKYFNITLDDVDGLQGSINNPIDALNAKSFNGKKITVTGYYNGASSNKNTGMQYINIVATKIVEFVDNPKGTETNPYSVSEIAKLITGGATFDENVFIKGKISKIRFTYSAQYGNANFWISDDGVAHDVSEDLKTTTATTEDFLCYSIMWLGNTAWAEGNAQVEEGDEVVICGQVTLYNGMAETASKKAWLYSVNGATTDANGLGNVNAPFNVAGAEAFIDRMIAAKAAATEAGSAEPTFPDVCVKGKVSAVLYPFNADKGTTSFWISDDGTAYGLSDDKKKTSEPTKDFECYGVYYFGNKAWQEGNKQLEVGQEVIVKGQLTLYGTTYETNNKKAWLYSVNGETE